MAVAYSCLDSTELTQMPLQSPVAKAHKHTPHGMGKIALEAKASAGVHYNPNPQRQTLQMMPLLRKKLRLIRILPIRNDYALIVR